MESNQEQNQFEPGTPQGEVLKHLNNQLNQKTKQLEIEAALEKVRIRAMNMRSSDELAETSAVMFHQLEELGIKTIRTGVGIYDDANEAMEVWYTIVSENKKVDRILDYFSLHIHPVFESIIPARNQNKPFTVATLVDDEVRQFYQAMSTYYVLPQQKEYNPIEFFYSFFFPEGSINLLTKKELTEEDCTTMIRMAGVFGLIYTRFLDLQKAEIYTRDTLRQASVDRVRAEIASMRTATDLEKIMPLIWKELSILGIPFFRCGVFIMKENIKTCQVFLTTPTGDSLAAMDLPFKSFELVDINVQHWRENKVYTKEWEQQDFINWTMSLVDAGYLANVENYQGKQAAPERMGLHFIPFEQGMLYVGNNSLLYQEHIDVVQALANAFSVAYARYEDFNHLEETLRELKAAQSQLIHAEKMASLGELTAGIAHEIQNPLNFVNNFSELNEELIGELKDEINKGNMDGIADIAGNLAENERKINHHGKRAEAIVRSMLKHSRGSSGEKKLIDLNSLCEEYLNLTYHGMRAKDKSFNVHLQTEFDPSIPEVMAIPQDIGRVLLNLINNAFFAVTQKKESESNQYVPKVMIRTGYKPSTSGEHKKGFAQIEIIDNGMGISTAMLDKIFQPFFTTKPTGIGTGLGLSLAYEIITKGHGGDLKVESEEGKGSNFIIRLPV